MPTPTDQKKKAEMARMLAEAEAEAISSDARDEDFTFGGPEGGWEALKAGFGKEATYGFGDEAAAALSGVETTDEERIASNEEMDAVINKNAINAALGFVGGVVPSIAGLAYGTLTKAAAKAAALAATKAAGPAAGLAASKLAAKEVVKTITPKMAIGINAAEGAVSGVGEGEGVGGRALGGVTGATIGGLVGSATQAIPGVTRAVADTISNDRKIQNAASEMAKADADRLARELAFQESVKVSKFKVAPPNPHLRRDIADIERDLRAINRLHVNAQRSGDKDALKALGIQRKSLLEAQLVKRPELATKTADIAKLEGNKNAAFTKEGFRAAMTDEELEAAADALEAAKKKKKGGGGEGEGGAGGGDSGGGGPRDSGGGSGLSSALKATEDGTIDPETQLPFTDELIKRKEITRETTRTPAIRRILREGEVANDDMEMARKRQEQLKFPFPEDPERIDIGQPEMNIERSDRTIDIYKTFIEPDTNVPNVDDSIKLTRRKQSADEIDDRIAEIESDNEKPTGSSVYERLQYANRQRELARLKKEQARRPGTNLRLNFSDVDVDEDGNFIAGNTFGFKNKSRRPTADELPTDKEITSANEAAALTRAMKAKNIPLNEARLQIPSRQLNPQAMMAAPQSPAATPQWSYPTPEGERGKIVINDNSPPATKKQPVIKRPYLTESELDAMDRFNPVFEEARIKAEEEDLDVSYKTALDMFVPTTKAEKADSVVLVELGYAPIQRPRLTVEAPKMFETSPGGTVRDVTDSDFYSISSQIGQGAYGRVHDAVNQQGKRKIIKVSAPADNEPDTLFDLRHERDVVEEMMKIRPTLPKEVAQHFVNTEKILTNPADRDNGFVLVMQELRPMNPRERLALYRGRSVEERAVGIPDPYIGKDFDFPTSSYNRRPLTAEDYKNMPYNVRKFYKALEYLADEKGIEWRDLHEGNVMVDPKTGEYVALDIGQFKLYGRTASGDPGTANAVKETLRGTRIGDTNTLARARKMAVEAAKKERNKTEE